MISTSKLHSFRKIIKSHTYKDSFDNIGEVSELSFNTDTLSTRYNFIINTKLYVILNFNVSTLINSNTYPILQSYITQFFTIDITFENPIDGQYLKDIKLKVYSEDETDDNEENVFDSYFITDDFNFTSKDNIVWESQIELKNFNVISTGLFVFYYIFDDIEYKSNAIIDSQEKMVDTSSADKSSYIVGQDSSVIEGDLID